MSGHFAAWRQKYAVTLRQLKVGCHPKEFITSFSEELLAHYTNQPLIDKYDVYQHLMDYWFETMQDDCYIIAADGWKAKTYRIIEKDKQGREKDKGWTCDLVPKSLIVARYFATEQSAIEKLTADLESMIARITALEEENSGDDETFSTLDKVNKATVTARLKEIKGDLNAKDEAIVLSTWLKLYTQETESKQRLKEAEAALDVAAYAKYPKLTEVEVQNLVVADKWLAALESAVNGETDRISQMLTRRVMELTERYETPLPQINNRVIELEARVSKHLERMGFSWK